MAATGHVRTDQHLGVILATKRALSRPFGCSRARSAGRTNPIRKTPDDGASARLDSERLLCQLCVLRSCHVRRRPAAATFPLPTVRAMITSSAIRGSRRVTLAVALAGSVLILASAQVAGATTEPPTSEPMATESVATEPAGTEPMATESTGSVPTGSEAPAASTAPYSIPTGLSGSLAVSGSSTVEPISAAAAQEFADLQPGRGDHGRRPGNRRRLRSILFR